MLFFLLVCIKDKIVFQKIDPKKFSPFFLGGWNADRGWGQGANRGADGRWGQGVTRGANGGNFFTLF
jgi:hypothetical protein